MTRLISRRQLQDARRNMRRIKEDGKDVRKSDNNRETIVFYTKKLFGSYAIYTKHVMVFSSTTLLKKFVRNNSDRFYKYAHVVTTTPEDYPDSPPEHWG